MREGLPEAVADIQDSMGHTYSPQNRGEIGREEKEKEKEMKRERERERERERHTHTHTPTPNKSL